MRILIVDDEKNIREILKLNLEMEGYECKALSDGRTAVETLNGEHFDLVLLDIMMPVLNGYDVLKQIRISHVNVPVIFLSAKDEAKDKITGLKSGAEDYITKPFHMEELLLRIKNVVKRKSDEPASDETKGIYRFDDNWIDFDKYTGYGNGRNLNLSKKEIMFLKLLIDHKNEVLSRQQILQVVWGYDVFPSTRTIDNFILSFRRYFEPPNKEKQYFYSIRGIGYKFFLAL
ncbi:MAG TPA: response regulator transcription factor [Saprospiraceae bacterium]|nr:response regulator transcription factor [Saprospiraceae bacterium]